MNLFILLHPGSLWNVALYDDNSVLVLKNTIHSEAMLFEQLQEIFGEYQIERINFGGSPENYVQKYVDRVSKLVPSNIMVRYER